MLKTHLSILILCCLLTGQTARAQTLIIKTTTIIDGRGKVLRNKEIVAFVAHALCVQRPHSWGRVFRSVCPAGGDAFGWLQRDGNRVTTRISMKPLLLPLITFFPSYTLN